MSLDPVVRSASISDCGTFRWTLTRTWGSGGRVLLFIMLNPSTATGEVDDNTIRRCMGFARRNGFDGIRVVNMIAFRATNPKVMYIWFLMQPPATLRQHARIVWAEMRREDVGAVVCAWGKPNKHIIHYANWFRNEIFKFGKRVYCLKRLDGNWPGHPLYLPNDSKLLVYREKTNSAEGL
jgi:hypothetical protein